jgi:DNA-binding IclR family transcriptional regulator
MRTLSQRTGGHSALSVLDQDTILYLKAVDPSPLRYASRAGDHAPLHCTAAGKVFLAHMPEPVRKEVLDNLRFEPLTPFTITEPADLMHELPGIVLRGYGTAVREEFVQVAGIAAPIKDEHGEVIACLSLWTTLPDDSTPSIEDNFARDLIATTRGISKRIGWIET